MAFEEIREIRIKKLQESEKKFGTAFPADVSLEMPLKEVVDNFTKFSRRRKPLVLCGRVMAVRGHGGVLFCDFNDGTSGLQACLKKDILGNEEFVHFQNLIDVGDFVEFEGTLFKTKKKEKSIKVVSWRMLSKSLRPLPEKWHGLLDVEERFRKRYLDLLMNKDARSVFETRSKIITELRNFLNGSAFAEVETLMLQPLAGGALAEPFKTHHNALDIDLFLRIAPELYLKRLLVADFPKVYEIGRMFRNEGIDATHNPEFTMLEFYEAYQNVDKMRDFVERMIKVLVKKVFGKQVVKYEGNSISFSKKFSVISFYDVLKRHALINDAQNVSREDLELKAGQFGIEVASADSEDKIRDNIFKKVCRAKIIQPTFVVDYPVELSPLAKKKKDNPNLVERFQLIMGGLEMVNGYSELNDPLEQKARFEKHQDLRQKGDKEAAEYDKDFVDAMEYGMPPAVGVGMGVDRLVMFLTDAHNIKEVILFPTMRPKEE